MRHAIMIMAHADWPGLRHLIELYDDEDVDFIIHINRRSGSWTDEAVRGITKKSAVVLAPRVAVSYCNYTQVEAILSLLRTAMAAGPYDYYHLISGSDLPIHPIAEFKEFFRKNRGKEFVGFSKDYSAEAAGHRSFFSNGIRTTKGLRQKILLRTNKLLQELQSKLRVNLAKDFAGEPRKGADWWSITDAAARLMVEGEARFKKSFRRAYCPSELFAQTLIYNSRLSADIYDMENENVGSLREIDWERGRPWVWRRGDFARLTASPCMFARKFDRNVDSEIIRLISTYIKGE